MEGDQSWNNEVCEDEGDIADGNYNNESKYFLVFKSDYEMVNGYCKKGENRISEESDGIESMMEYEPMIRMIYDSRDKAYEYSDTYARKIGFSIETELIVTKFIDNF
ncbi:hypothetical protein MKX01_020009 [Papaver californicum]|nr:hypothetical protein MKX01_020009 [Papaver californicum]